MFGRASGRSMRILRWSCSLGELCFGVLLFGPGAYCDGPPVWESCVLAFFLWLLRVLRWACTVARPHFRMLLQAFCACRDWLAMWESVSWRASVWSCTCNDGPVVWESCFVFACTVMGM